MDLFTLKVEGCPPFENLTQEQVDALIETARKFPSPDPTTQGGPRIDVTRET